MIGCALTTSGEAPGSFRRRPRFLQESGPLPYRPGVFWTVWIASAVVMLRSTLVSKLSKRPRRVLAYERLGIIEGLLERWHILHRASVTEHRGGVAL